MKSKIILISSLIIFLLSSFAVSNAALLNVPAIDFTLTSLAREDISLSDFKGKVVFINFWASWCGPCKEEYPELVKMLKEYGDDVVLLAINEDKKKSHIYDFIKRFPKHSDNFIILLDMGGKIISKYRAAALPTSVVVDSAGIKRFVHFGFNKKEPVRWRSEIDQLLKELKSDI